MDIHHLVPLIFAHFHHHGRPGKSGIVDEHIESPVFFGSGVHETFHVCLDGNIGFYSHRRATHGLNFSDDVIGGVLIGCVVDDYIRPARCKTERDCFAYTTAASGYQCDFSL